MDGCIIFDNGLGVGLDFACYDTYYICTWYVVCIGWWFVLFGWCNILSMAPYEICTCVLAFVRDWGQRVFLFRSALRIDNRFCNEVHSIIKPPYWRFFNQMDFLPFYIQLLLVNVQDEVLSQHRVLNNVYKIQEYQMHHQH